MLTNIFSYVLDALNYQGIAIVAWVGVAMAHVIYIRRRRLALDRMEWPARPRAGVQSRRDPRLGRRDGFRAGREDHRRRGLQFLEIAGLP